jgi:Flp pilus assembly protein TadG
MSRERSSRQHEGGQTLVVVALAMVALLGMSALVVDGGNAFAQQRGSQNGSDAASEAGATVLAQGQLSLASGGAGRTDANVLAGMNASAAANRIQPFTPGVAGNSSAWYTDVSGNLLTAAGATTTDPLLAVQVGAAAGNAIPPCLTNCVGSSASGVRAQGMRPFKTFIAGVVGFSDWTATTVATATAGYGPSVCDAAQGCALLPITFSVQMNTCDGSGNAVYSGATWLPTQPAGPPYTSANEVTLSICKKGEGAFGWLDYGCGNTAAQISDPCNVQVYFPTWLLGQPGNPNNVEDELNDYAGNVVGTYEASLDEEVLIPFFDGVCNEDRPGEEPPNPPGDEAPIFAPPAFPGECASNPSGGGANRHFHVPFFIGFILDHAYVQGSNFPACNVAPGGPLPGGNGSGGCLKGWFARVVAAPGPVSANPGGAGNATPLSVQLIK